MIPIKRLNKRFLGRRLTITTETDKLLRGGTISKIAYHDDKGYCFYHKDDNGTERNDHFTKNVVIELLEEGRCFCNLKVWREQKGLKRLLWKKREPKLTLVSVAIKIE